MTGWKDSHISNEDTSNYGSPAGQEYVPESYANRAEIG